jgi:hypothetical protein
MTYGWITNRRQVRGWRTTTWWMLRDVRTLQNNPWKNLSHKVVLMDVLVQPE